VGLRQTFICNWPEIPYKNYNTWYRYLEIVVKVGLNFIPFYTVSVAAGGKGAGDSVEVSIPISIKRDRK
jgi:hypothetical protein